MPACGWLDGNLPKLAVVWMWPSKPNGSYIELSENEKWSRNITGLKHFINSFSWLILAWFTDGLRSVSLSVCLSACLPVCLSACLTVCLSVCLPACLPVSVCHRPSLYTPPSLVTFSLSLLYKDQTALLLVMCDFFYSWNIFTFSVSKGTLD